MSAQHMVSLAREDQRDIEIRDDGHWASFGWTLRSDDAAPLVLMTGEGVESNKGTYVYLRRDDVVAIIDHLMDCLKELDKEHDNDRDHQEDARRVRADCG